MRFVPRDVPVVPDADTARQWARDELLEPAYHRGKSLLDRIVDWVVDLVQRIFAGGEGLGADPRIVGIVMLGVVIAVALVALWIAGPVRRSRRAARDRLVFDAADARTAEQMRAAATTAARSGNWHDAVLERFRAIVRALEERALLEERAGRTAHEVAVDAGRTLPGVRGALLTASTTFDEVCYGDAQGTAAQYEGLVALDTQIQSTRPERSRPADDDAPADLAWAPTGGAR